MSQIAPHLWFDKEAKEAAQFYASIFPRSKVTSVRTLRGTPSGDTDVVSFELAGQPFIPISGTQAQIDRLTQAFLASEEADIAKLQSAFEGR